MTQKSIKKGRFVRIVRNNTTVLAMAMELEISSNHVYVLAKKFKVKLPTRQKTLPDCIQIFDAAKQNPTLGPVLEVYKVTRGTAMHSIERATAFFWGRKSNTQEYKEYPIPHGLSELRIMHEIKYCRDNQRGINADTIAETTCTTPEQVEAYLGQYGDLINERIKLKQRKEKKNAKPTD